MLVDVWYEVQIIGINYYEFFLYKKKNVKVDSYYVRCIYKLKSKSWMIMEIGEILAFSIFQGKNKLEKLIK